MTENIVKCEDCKNQIVGRIYQVTITNKPEKKKLCRDCYLIHIGFKSKL